jgi:hypothetical protein
MSFLFYFVSIFVPILGRYRGLRAKGFLVLSGILLGIVSTFGIPSLLSAVYFRCMVSHRALWNRYLQGVLSILIPAFCMILFSLHPVAGQAWFYSLYWLIPIVIGTIGLLGYKMIFLDYICATFIAHAVGSVIWCYLMPITVGKWFALIPLVAVERFVFAGSQFLFVLAISFLSSAYSTMFSRRREIDATSCNDYGRQSSVGAGE